LGGAAGSIGAALFQALVAFAAARGSYDAAFALMSASQIAGALLITFGIRPETFLEASKRNSGK